MSLISTPRTAGYVLTLCLLLPAGCGSPQLAEVSGVVTLDGQPVAGARVLLLPQAPEGLTEAGPSSMGTTDQQGRFRARTVEQSPSVGAMIGKHRVVISTRRQQPDPATGGEAVIVVAEERIPHPYYNLSDTPLTLQVPSGGTSEANFALESPANLE